MELIVKEQPSLVKSLGYATAFARRSVDKIGLSCIWSVGLDRTACGSQMLWSY